MSLFPQVFDLQTNDTLVNAVETTVTCRRPNGSEPDLFPAKVLEASPFLAGGRNLRGKVDFVLSASWIAATVLLRRVEYVDDAGAVLGTVYSDAAGRATNDAAVLDILAGIPVGSVSRIALTFQNNSGGNLAGNALGHYAMSLADNVVANAL